MVNLNIAYRAPAPCLTTLTKELTTRFGTPSRWYEFIAGSGPTTWNISSHNADANGLAHGVDIFVGAGHNISVEQGIDLAERLRLEGKKGDIAGHPDRLAYIIHRGRIAGDHTGWEWIKYNGIADHYDHIHVSSVFDYYWGDPVWAVHASNYNSTIPWNLWGTTTAAKPSPVPPSTSGSYAVRAGDTMSAIAAAHGVTLAALLKANPKVYPNLIHPGDKLTLPAKAAAPTPVVKPAPAKVPAAPALVNRYVTNANAYLLTAPTTNAPTFAVYPKGTPLAIKGYVGGQDPYGTGDTAWYVTGSGHYVWANAAEDNVAGLRFLGNM